LPTTEVNGAAGLLGSVKGDKTLKGLNRYSSFKAAAKNRPGVNQIDHLVQDNQSEKNKGKAATFIEIIYSVLGSIRQPFLVLDHNLKVIKANCFFCEMFNVNPNETEGQLIFNFGNRQLDIPKMREQLAKILDENVNISDYEVDFSSKRKLHINACRISYKNSAKSQLILLFFSDVIDSEYHDNDHESLVADLKIELCATRREAKKRTQIAEQALSKVKNLEEQLEAERAYLQEEIELVCNHGKIVGQSDGLKYVLYKMEQIASSDTTVLILGETGTGKDLVARALHELSPRNNRPLVKVNCAALPANLIESELFGHEKGAFTDSHAKHIGRFEVANGGTFFLDEIGELPLELQGKLLRVLQDGELERLGSSRTIKVDTRIIAATNRNLEEEVRKGRFREDLWYRLNIFPITMPPLRDRQDDIPLLVEFYVNKIAKRMGKTIEFIPGWVMEALQQYHWPGNVRELENVLERAVINSSGPKLRLDDELKLPPKTFSRSLKTMAAVEREYILQVLEQTKWKISGENGAANILGLDRSTLRGRMIKLQIERHK
jgi:chemotaxis protein methyltransferase CheR